MDEAADRFRSSVGMAGGYFQFHELDRRCIRGASDKPHPPIPMNVEPPAPGQSHTWEVLCHVAAVAGYVIPFGNIIGPLVVWLLKRSEVPAVEAHGKEALNFQISVTIYAIVCILLIFVAIGFFLLIGLGIAALVLVIIASIKASSGELYRYPLTIRFIK